MPFFVKKVKFWLSFQCVYNKSAGLLYFLSDFFKQSAEEDYFTEFLCHDYSEHNSALVRTDVTVYQLSQNTKHGILVLSPFLFGS